MAEISMTLTLDEAYLGQTRQVSDALEAMGFKVESVLPEIGVVTGSGEEALLDRVRGLEGVAEARPTGALRLPPFSSRVPQ